MKGKHKKGNNYIESNDIANVDAENSSKRKGLTLIQIFLVCSSSRLFFI